MARWARTASGSGSGRFLGAVSSFKARDGFKTDTFVRFASASICGQRSAIRLYRRVVRREPLKFALSHFDNSPCGNRVFTSFTRQQGAIRLEKRPAGVVSQVRNHVAEAVHLPLEVAYDLGNGSTLGPRKLWMEFRRA
jgi:hypothetical protein